MRKLIITGNNRFVTSGMGISVNDGNTDEEINLDLATEEEFVQLMNDPYNDILIDKIKDRA